jgi:hypothetical protein
VGSGVLRADGGIDLSDSALFTHFAHAALSRRREGARAGGDGEAGSSAGAAAAAAADARLCVESPPRSSSSSSSGGTTSPPFENGYAALNVGVLAGRLEWTAEIVHDVENGEKCCFGVARPPAKVFGFASNPDMPALVRA